MHENKLSTDIIAQFTNKSNQSIEQLLHSFDYINDPSICIRNPSQKGKQKEIVDKNTDQVLKKAIPAAEEDPIENIDLARIEAKVNGFWSENGNNPVTTKFNNFLSEDENLHEEELTETTSIENNRNRAVSFDLDQMFSTLNNLQYTPTLVAEKVKSSINIEQSIEQNKSELKAISYLIENEAKSNVVFDDDKQQESEVISTVGDSSVDELEENQSVVFPGEITADEEKAENGVDELTDFLSCVEQRLRVTCLDITTETQTSQVISELAIYDDEVTAFQLDSDHDYNMNLNRPRFDFACEK